MLCRSLFVFPLLFEQPNVSRSSWWEGSCHFPLSGDLRVPAVRSAEGTDVVPMRTGGRTSCAPFGATGTQQIRENEDEEGVRRPFPSQPCILWLRRVFALGFRKGLAPPRHPLPAGSACSRLAASPPPASSRSARAGTVLPLPCPASRTCQRIHSVIKNIN